MRRREFLKVGSAGAMATLALGSELSGIPELSSLAQAAGLQLTSPLSIGFWDGSATSKVVSANSLARGDRSFDQSGVRLKFCGIRSTSGSAAFADIVSLTIDVNYRPYTDTRFLAWMLNNSGYQKKSSSLSVVVPITATNGLGLIVGLQAPGTAVQQVPVTLSTKSGLFTPKLLEGSYFIAISGSSNLGVNWSEYRAVADGGGAVLAAASGGRPRSSSSSNSLTYFALQIAHTA
ncbi:MAG TPA: hypothetical protein VNE17_14880 [Nitrolancea sp.]|nr:hypothetical protein [Nitrolancea sp.]